MRTFATTFEPLFGTNKKAPSAEIPIPYVPDPFEIVRTFVPSDRRILWIVPDRLDT